MNIGREQQVVRFEPLVTERQEAPQVETSAPERTEVLVDDRA